MTAIFQLAPLPLEHPSTPFASSSKLPNIRPRFVLPPLDDHISSTQRLLNSLRGRSTYELQDLQIPSTPTKSNSNLPTKGLALESEEGQAKVDGDEHDNVDIWLRATEEPIAGPSNQRVFKPLHTWDNIASSENDPVRNIPLLSEKSTFTFDALLTSLEPPIYLPKLSKSSGSIPIHDSKTLLETMMRSTLGTTTTENLKWNTKRARYIWEDDAGRPMGVERVTANSVIERFLEIGTAIRRLEIIVNSQSALPLTPTHHALLHALATYLNFVKQRLKSAIEDSLKEPQAGWNKWLGVTNDVRELGEMLCEVMCWSLSTSEAIFLPSRPSALLTHMYNHLLASLSIIASYSHSPSSLALAFIFSKSVGPFLSLLRAWVGLSGSSAQDDDLDPNSQPWLDLGIIRKATHSGSLEYTFSSRKMPSFIPKSERRTLFEAGKNLRLLREASNGTHPLCSGDWGIEVSVRWGNENSPARNPMQSHTKRVKREINMWRRADQPHQKDDLLNSRSSTKLRLSLRRSRKERKQIPMELFSPPPSASTDINQITHQDGVPNPDFGVPELDNLWSLFNQSPGSHLQHRAQLEESKQLWTPTPLEELRSFLSRHTSESLLPYDSPTLPLFISTHLLTPLLTHSKLISSSLVSFYLDDLHLLEHLDILYAYWLGGDVNFIGRVSSSLFGKDSAGAGEALGLGRRARTRVRLGLDPILTNNNTRKDGDIVEKNSEWGIGLGVGLSERSKWPPGGSELAYALRTTLLDDSDTTVKNGNHEGGPGPWNEIEDRVSFAIKQLDEEDKGRKAKWLDPQGELIYLPYTILSFVVKLIALDFLYLAYSPPQSMTDLLPKSLLAKYQSIHNLILRLSRCQIVLRTMYWSVLHQLETTDELYKTGVDQRGKRPSSRNTLRRSRERELNSLFPAKSSIEKRVQMLRFRMSHVVSAFGEYTDSVISHKWGIMRRRLKRMKSRNPVIDDRNSRPSSPSLTEIEDRHEENEDEYTIPDSDYDNNDASDEDEVDNDIYEINQLQSPHSILLYHQITLDKILRSCLLGQSQGQQVTYKIFMTLLGLILNTGKILVEVEKGLKGWQDGKEQIEEIDKEWNEKEAVFLHALERLSLRTDQAKPINEEDEEVEEGEKTEHDLQILLSGEHDDDEENNHNRGRGKGDDDLKELLLRLRLGNSELRREGRWKK
ncbi:uncharacterized protein L201_004324 [Kwoniella dendrophila CBS 6074]|uniref:Spindle pole body component n=1 Tax=Kwoniella dendrophila CBS 6074 TaxID=1295534 RepID=A0AAX4JXV6_9TREE